MNEIADIRARFDAASEDVPTVEAEEAFTGHCLSDMGLLFDEINRLTERAEAERAEAKQEIEAVRDLCDRKCSDSPRSRRGIE